MVEAQEQLLVLPLQQDLNLAVVHRGFTAPEPTWQSLTRAANGGVRVCVAGKFISLGVGHRDG